MKRGRAAKRRRAYHHGDLAAALVAAAEEIIAERGVEGFTLREAARRAGVSHAAPTHHFGDARGLLTELAAAGFERLTAIQAKAAAEVDAKRRVNEIGVSYVRFALANPALFRLMFHSKLVDRTSERIRTTGRAAFGVFLNAFSAARGAAIPALTPPEAGRNPMVLRQWAVVHGLATLSIEGQLGPAGAGAEKRLVAATRDALNAVAAAKDAS